MNQSNEPTEPTAKREWIRLSYRSGIVQEWGIEPQTLNTLRNDWRGQHSTSPAHSTPESLKTYIVFHQPVSGDAVDLTLDITAIESIIVYGRRTT